MENKLAIILSARDETKAAFASANKSLEALSSRAASVVSTFKSVTSVVVAGFGVSYFAGLIKSSIDAQDKLNDLSKSTGVAVEDLAGLGSAASKSGADLESIAQAVNKLSVNIGKDPEKFKAIGVTAREPIEALKQLADVFVSIQDPQTRAAVAAEALGKSWQGVAPLLAEGGKAIGKMVDRGKDLSKVTEESAAKADKLNDQLSELKTTIDGMKNSIANNMAEPMTELIKAIQTTYEESGKLAALWTSLGALGAFLFTDEFSSNQVKLKKLQETLVDLNKDREAYNPFSFFGKSLKEIDAEIANTTSKIEYLKKSMAPATKAAVEVPKVPGLYTPGAGFKSDIDVKAFLGQERKPKTGGKAPAEKIAELTASTKDYQAAMESLSNTLNSAQASTMGLDAAQETLHKLMLSPEWETYSAAMKWSAIEQASFASGAASAADAQKRLNDLMGDTPTAQLEKAQKDADLLEQALSKAANATDYKKIKEALDNVYVSTNKGTEAIKEQNDVARELGMTFSSAFEDAIVGGKKFSDVLKGLGEDILRLVTRKNITEPLAGAFSSFDFSSLLGGLFSSPASGTGGLFANGGVFSSPSLSAYSGGVYNSPQMFKFASGAGVFGEAGPEAIMPLKRGPDGKLGVASASSVPEISVVINNTVSDQAQANVQPRMNNGKLELEVMIEKVLSRDMQQNGRITQGFSNTFGLARAV